MVKTIKVGYFPMKLILVTPGAVLLGVYFYYGYYHLTGVIIGLLGVLIGVLTLTTFYITAFDREGRVYQDYITILGLGFNRKKKAFEKIKKIVVTRGRHQHTVRFPGAQPYLVNWQEFTAVLLYDDDQLELMTKKDKRKLIKEVKGLV